MKKLMLAAIFAVGTAIGLEAAPTDNVTQADLQAIIERLNKLEAENKAQAKKIAELEGKNQALAAKAEKAEKTAPVVAKKDAKLTVDEGAEVSESGKIVTAKNGKQYYLADACAGIFEPLSESGLQITPYGYLVFEGVWADHGLDLDWTTDFVHPKSSSQYGNHNSTLSVQDSIFGIKFEAPELVQGWKFSGKAEFDLAGDNADDYAFHWRHLYVNAEHDSGWSFLFGQTWHLWKMVTPSEIDGAWMENAGHPYRRSPQIRVTKQWKFDDDSKLEARVGFVKNGPNASADRDHDGMLDSTTSAWGWFEGAVTYDRKAGWQDGKDNDRWLVGIGGMYGKTCAHQATEWDGDGQPFAWDGDEDEYESKMLMLAAQVPFWDFTLTGQIFFGNNLGRIQAGCAQDIAYQPYQAKGTGVGTYGGFIDLTYKLNDDWDFAIGYGFDDPVDSDVEGTYGILFNDRAYIDAFYHITGNFKLGLEYARLTTKYDGEGTSFANRIQFSAFYDF